MERALQREIRRQVGTANRGHGESPHHRGLAAVQHRPEPYGQGRVAMQSIREIPDEL